MFLVSWDHWSENYTWHKTCETHCFKTKEAASKWIDNKIQIALEDRPDLVLKIEKDGNYKELDDPTSNIWPSWFYQFNIEEIHLDFKQNYMGMLATRDYSDDV